jgi:hypothetical protein
LEWCRHGKRILTPEKDIQNWLPKRVTFFAFCRHDTDWGISYTEDVNIIIALDRNTVSSIKKIKEKDFT